MQKRKQDKRNTWLLSNDYEQDDLVSVFKDVLKSNEKYFYFVTKRLRSAKNKFKKG
jgi:hypothetical protein